MQITLSFFQLKSAINKSSYITKFKSIFNDKIKKKETRKYIFLKLKTQNRLESSKSNDRNYP